jgi:hypothetical protein
MMKASVKQILVFYDAPELVLAETKRALKYLCLTVESTSEETKALCAPVSEEKLEMLRQGKIDVRSLFTHPRTNRWYTTDLSKGDEIPLIKFAQTRWDIPDEWLPNFDFYLESGTRGAQSKKTTVTIAIGQRWELRDLQQFSHKYEEVYALLYSTLHGSSSSAPAYRQYPWRRGLSSVLFYDDLQSNVPRAARPVVESINYNSPGSIALTVLADVNAQMRSMLGSVVEAPKHASQVYREIHAELGKRKLLGENPTKSFTQRYDGYLKDSLRQLGAAIGFRDVSKITNYSDDPLRALKILLSLYRRLMSLREYVEDEKVDFKKSFR